MRGKRLLATVLLGVGLCFVPVLGHGEVKEWMNEATASFMEVSLLRATVNYIMYSPTNFLAVRFLYDPTGEGGAGAFPRGVNTKGKIVVRVEDGRGVFSDRTGRALRSEFKEQLEFIYSFIRSTATDMDTDVVAVFYSRELIPLGYFYQGEYHLWEK